MNSAAGITSAALTADEGQASGSPSAGDAAIILSASHQGNPCIQDVHDALYAAKLVSYAQGFMLLRAASQRFGWNLAYGDIALLWRGGGLIPSRLLGGVKGGLGRGGQLKVN